MEIEAKIVIYSLCLFLHTMDTLVQLGGFWLSMCMFSGRGESRNYCIGRVGGGPSLIDILIDLYLLFTECFDSTFQRGHIFPRREEIPSFSHYGGRGR